MSLILIDRALKRTGSDLQNPYKEELRFCFDDDNASKLIPLDALRHSFYGNKKYSGDYEFAPFLSFETKDLIIKTDSAHQVVFSKPPGCSDNTFTKEDLAEISALIHDHVPDYKESVGVDITPEILESLRNILIQNATTEKSYEDKSMPIQKEEAELRLDDIRLIQPLSPEQQAQWVSNITQKPAPKEIERWIDAAGDKDSPGRTRC